MAPDALRTFHHSLYLEDIVQDEEEFTTPPPIFISYQWSLQEEVKLLKTHLEMAGYEGYVLSMIYISPLHVYCCSSHTFLSLLGNLYLK